MNIHEFADRLACVFFPARCVLCGEVVCYDDYCCGKCPRPVCGASGGDVVSAFFYEDPIRQAIWRMKEKPDRRTIWFFALEMERAIEESRTDDNFDLLVPIPLNAAKQKERGFNQAERLARELGALIQVPIEEQTLTRLDSTLVQQGLGMDDRLKNAQASYRINNGKLAQDKRILLVDDVYTTGATIRTCMELLTAAGAKSVHAVTAARTAERRERLTSSTSGLPGASGGF